MQEKDRDDSQKKSNRPRRLNGIVILVLIIAALIVISYRPTVARVHCTAETLDSNPEVIMLGTWWCPYCYQARRYLTSRNVSYCEYDIEQSAEGRRLFDEVNGRAIPVLIVDRYMMSGFDETQLEALLDKAREAS